MQARLNGARAALAIALAATTTFAAPATAQSTRTACLARRYDAYASAQRDYQWTIERLVVRADTTLAALAALARAEQIARIDARQRAVETLLVTSPRSVHVDRSVNQWLDWGPAETERLRRIDPVFARLDSAARAAATRTSDHASWPRLRAAISERVVPSPEHRAALDRLNTTMNVPPRCG
jgi:hypothetical protein